MTFSGRLARLKPVFGAAALEVSAVVLAAEVESRGLWVEDRAGLLMFRGCRRSGVADRFLWGASTNGRQMQVAKRRNGEGNCNPVAERLWSPSERQTLLCRGHGDGDGDVRRRGVVVLRNGCDVRVRSWISKPAAIARC